MIPNNHPRGQHGAPDTPSTQMTFSLSLPDKETFEKVLAYIGSLGEKQTCASSPMAAPRPLFESEPTPPKGASPHAQGVKDTVRITHYFRKDQHRRIKQLVFVLFQTAGIEIGKSELIQEFFDYAAEGLSKDVSFLGRLQERYGPLGPAKA